MTIATAPIAKRSLCQYHARIRPAPSILLPHQMFRDCNSVNEFFNRLCTFSAIYTFMYGVNTCLGIPAIVEVHGNKQLALIYGLELLSYGIGNSISTPIATYMGSELGAYKMGVQLSGVIVIIGGLILLPHLIIKYVCKRQSADMKNTEES